MNTQDNRPARSGAKKAMAIGGFIGSILLIAWLSVQLTHLVPGAFASLASLAESIREYQPAREEKTGPQTLTVTSDATLVPVSQPVTISWSTANLPGSYTFTYSCVEGVSIEVLDHPDLQAIDCERTYDLGDRAALTIALESVKDRFTDVTYTIGYYRTTDASPRATGTASLTVVNSALASDSDPVSDRPTAPTTPEPATPAPTPGEPTPAPISPEAAYEYTYLFPTSDPDGYTDLGINYIATGALSPAGGFTAQPLVAGETGAIQFAVQNHGSKTSAPWTFSVSLPTGTTYESDTQEPLLPNERALMTISFTVPADTSSHTFTGEVDVARDRTALNDRFVVREEIR